MKFTILLLALGAYFTYGIIVKTLQFRKNYQDAKRSGLPIIISPVYPLWHLWLAAERMVIPLLRKVPLVKHQYWLDVSSGDWVWDQRYDIFKRLGSDTFMIVTSWKNVVYTCDAGAINQITTRRADFPKPVEVYGTIDTYGKNVVSAEGQEWRRHRKITAPPFSEKNNHLVWRESLYQAQNMLKQWTGPEGKGGITWDNISADAMRLSLHIISRAGFNVRCLWPGIDDEDVDAIRDGAMSTAIIPSGHKLSYVEAMSTLLHRIVIVFIFPDWLANIIPLEYVKRAQLAKSEWGQYMRELYQRKIAALTNYNKGSATSKDDPSLDLMGAMITNSGILDGSHKADPHAGLDESEIIGNSFVFMLAGHETAANTITHALYFLAMNPAAQKQLQKELDELFQGRPISEWDYDRDLQPLFGGMSGAVMNETLRLIPPVVVIPKSTFRVPDQKLSLDDRDAVIPAGTYVGLCANTSHRNPKYWPHGAGRSVADGGPIHAKSDSSNDLDEFKPERWILDPAARQAEESKGDDVTQKDADEVGVNTAADTAASLYRPPKGAYIPFSEGFRACLGRRFAQVEILSTLAVLFQLYSVELAVDEWVNDEDLQRMTRTEKGEVWTKARSQAERYLNEGMGTIITIQLRNGKIPVRFTRRGQETFADSL